MKYKIREMRNSRGMTQAALAEKLEITSEAVSLWERGLREPMFPTMVRVADALGCSLYDLFEEQE